MGRIILGLLLAMLPLDAAVASGRLTVFAAASLTDALRAVDAAWAAAGHPEPLLSFASSGTLARQIEAGAPASIFISADERWMDDLDHKGALAAGSRRDLLGNALVLVEPAADAAPVTITPRLDLARLLGPHGRLAIGGAGVPAGIYAGQALRGLGLWDAVKDRLAPATDVRAALLEVERGAAPAGIVYRSDARVAPGVTPGVTVVGTFPEASHLPIVYPAAALRDANLSEARAYLAFLGTPDASRIFADKGFTVLPPRR